MLLLLKLFFVILCVTVFSKCSPSVIIIGAGPAGIAAASKLLQNSITNITILEAENKIGGRINSLQFGEKFVDLGAEYCHGKTNNIVYELVKDLNLLEPISETFQPSLYYSNGSKLEKAFTEELQAVILGYDSSDIHFENDGISSGELFIKEYNATIIQRYRTDKQKIKILKEALRLAEKVSLMIDGAFSWLDTSTVKHYERSEGHQLLVWKGRGYKTILEVLTKEFPNPEQKLPMDDKLFLNKQVSGIKWNTNNIVVETTDNSKYFADHVIFTPSIGVLKDQKDSLFTPSLPKDKLDAIKAIGIAGVMKIILHFEHEWWQNDDTLFTFLWSDEDLHNSAKEFSHGPTKDGISWVSAISVIAKVPGNPKVLVIWVTGKFIPEIEQTPDSVVSDGCVYVLKKFLRGYSITKPDRIIKSSWRSNLHFRGTYSYERAGFENKNVSYQLDLAKPLVDEKRKPIVLFAGEASNPVHYSTVHGAIETGYREAERIISLYQKTRV